MGNEGLAMEAPKAPIKRGTVKRRQPRALTPEQLERNEKRAAARSQQPRQPSDLCDVRPLGVVEIIPGSTVEVVRWRCPKDLRVMFAALFIETIDEAAMLEARLSHNSEYLGSVPLAQGENSKFLALMEIPFTQFDLIRVEIAAPPPPLEAVNTSGGPAGDIPVYVQPTPAVVGPADFIVRYK